MNTTNATHTMYGADSVELEALAAELEGYRDELGDLLRQGIGAVSLVGLSATLHTVWRGPRASDFAAVWQSRHLLQIRAVQDLLTDAVSDLRANAEQQRSVSRVISPGMGPLKFFVTPHDERIIEAFGDALGRPGSELADYWAGLDGFERGILMRHKPEWVMSLMPLGLLSAAEVKAVKEAYLAYGLDNFDLVERSTEETVRVEADVKFLYLGAEGSISLDEVKTGAGTKYVVSLSAAGDLAIGINVDEAAAHAGLTGGVTMQYEFDSLREAQEFRDGLKDRLIPDKGDWVEGVLLTPVFGLGGGVAKATLSDVKGYLDQHSGHMASSRVHGGVTWGAEVDTDGFEAVIDDSVEAFYDTRTGERGVMVEFERQLRAELGILGIELEGDLQAEAKAELVWDGDGVPDKLEIKIDLRGTVGADVGDAVGKLVGPVDDLSGAGGAVASVTTSLDVSNPRNRLLAQAALAGEPQALQQLLTGSEVAVQLGTVSATASEAEFGTAALHAEAHHLTEDYVNRATFVKPPHSEIVRL